jgi:amino-acid N-acetyltransferase
VSSAEIIDLQQHDLTQFEALLRLNHLPTEDCVEQAANFCAIYDGDELIAAGGLEPASVRFGLLRSIVVQDRHRGKGLARQMTMHLLQQAKTDGREAVFLLTETATDYFATVGFQSVARDAVPAEITLTRQFSSLCPESASCMCLRLSAD